MALTYHHLVLSQASLWSLSEECEFTVWLFCLALLEILATNIAVGESFRYLDVLCILASGRVHLVVNNKVFCTHSLITQDVL